MSEEHISRRTILGGVAALAAGLTLTATPRTARAGDAADAEQLNAARRRSLEIIGVFDQAAGALMGASATAVIAGMLAHFREQHRDAATQLAAAITALGGTPIAEGAVPPLTAPARFTPSATNYLKYACNLSRSAASDHAAMLESLASRDAATLVAAIAGTQAQHFTVLYLMARGIAGPGPLAAAMVDEIAPRSFVSLAARPAQSLVSVPDLNFT